MNRLAFDDLNLPVEETSPQRGFDLRELFQLVWAGKWLIFVCMLAGFAAAYGYSKSTTPRYFSTGAVMLDSRQQNVIDLQSVLSDVPLNTQVIESELLVIRSDRLLGRVVDKLRLDRDPEYNKAFAVPTPAEAWWDDQRSMVSSWVKTMTPQSIKDAVQGDDGQGVQQSASVRELTEAEKAAAARREAIRILQSRVRTRHLSPAFAIEIGISSADPVKAALIANTIADQYVLDQLEAKFEAARRATTWLTDRLSELRDRVEASEAKIQAYTSANQTGDSQAVDITRQQIAEINSQLINARAERAQAQAQFGQAQRLVNSLGASQAATTLASPLTIALRNQRAELERSAAELSNRYGPRHPTMIELANKRRDINAAIASEVRQIVNGMENDVRIASARVTALGDGLTELESQAVLQSEAGVGLSQLEREAEANRQIYNNFLQRLNETREQEGFQTADSRVIKQAIVPAEAYLPKTKMTVALGTIGGGALGLALLALSQLFIVTFRTAMSVTEQTGLPVLAGMPRLSRRRRTNLLAYLRARPNSDFSEAVRTLRNAMLSNNDTSFDSVLIASALPSEGKSTLSIVTAEMMARMGRSVLLVDCDFRRPAIAKALRLRPVNDLVNVIDRDLELEEAVIAVENANFDLLPLKSGQANRADSLASPRFAQLIAEMRGVYDFIVVDGPPILGIGDFPILSSHAQVTVLAVQWNATPVSVFKRALKVVSDNNIKALGAVVTMIDRRREAQYDLKTGGAEYSYFRKYYTD